MNRRQPDSYLETIRPTDLRWLLQSTCPGLLDPLISSSVGLQSNSTTITVRASDRWHIESTTMLRSSRSGLAVELHTDHLPEDERNQLLASEERRLALDALDALAGRTSSIELKELAAEVASQQEVSVAVEEGSLEKVATMLHHAHLPKMDDMGIVEYDPQTNVVVPQLESRW